MQIVIDIPEEIKKKRDARKVLSNDEIATICVAIKNGTPLPKGHGRLIDADELKKHKYHDSDRFENAVSIAHIDWADTIIEADGGEE